MRIRSIQRIKAGCLFHDIFGCARVTQQDGRTSVRVVKGTQYRRCTAALPIWDEEYLPWETVRDRHGRWLDMKHLSLFRATGIRAKVILCLDTQKADAEKWWFEDVDEVIMQGGIVEVRPAAGSLWRQQLGQKEEDGTVQYTGETFDCEPSHAVDRCRVKEMIIG